MKKIIPLAAVCCAAFFLSCHKSHTAGSLAPSCKLTGVQVTGNGWSGTYVMSYDNADKLTSVHYTESTGTTYTKSFKYDANVIVVTTTTGSSSSTDSVILSANGYVDHILMYEGVTKTATDTFSYDGNQHLTKSVFSPIGGTDVVATYQYSDEDITAMDQSTLHISFTYFTDKASSMADPYVLGQWIQYGMVFQKSRHLRKSEATSSVVENFTYTFDTEGKITSATQNSGGSDETTFSYTYDCN